MEDTRKIILDELIPSMMLTNLGLYKLFDKIDGDDNYNKLFVLDYIIIYGR